LVTFRKEQGEFFTSAFLYSMGNKPSSSSQSTELLATFTHDEQAQIKQQYAKAVGQSSSPDKHSKTASLPRATFEHVLCPHVDEALRSALAAHLVEMSNANNDVITQEGFIRGAYSLARENKAESIYSLYTKVSPSLQQFVTHVINSALPFWWQGSTLSIEKWDSNENRRACKQLADYLVFGKPPAQGYTLTEDDLFSTGSAEANTSWNDETTHNVSADTFQAWLTGNMEFSLLIDILICSIFWPESADRDKARTQHHLAPALDKPKLPNTDSFSNLLDPYMYYLLTLHMPVDCLASTHPSKAIPHSLLFSSKLDGKSWQNFANNIVNRGALVIVIKTSDGAVFGGYTDQPLQSLTRWTGNRNNFLFRQSPMGLWDAANGTNDHYQYLCWGKKSLPNGKKRHLAYLERSV
jgi:TLD